MSQIDMDTDIQEEVSGRVRSLVDLYTILVLPILYGAWHTHGRSGGGSDAAQ